MTCKDNLKQMLWLVLCFVDTKKTKVYRNTYKCCNYLGVHQRQADIPNLL